MVLGHSVGTADKNIFCSGGSTTNCCYKLHIITEITDDTKPTYHINKKLGRYIDGLIRKTDFTGGKIQEVMKTQNLLNQMYNFSRFLSTFKF